jgi:hypothetical protein
VQQFTRYVGSGFNNVQPWWFYPLCLVVLLFPWTFFALAEGVAGARQWRRGVVTGPVSRQALSLCWIWVGAILVFFSIPQSKLIGYILPVTPPLALLAAAGWGRLMDGRRRAGAWLAGLAALMLAVSAATSVASRYFPALARSSQGVAQVLACAAAPDDPVYVAGGAFPYDLPFYAGTTQPLIVVQHWAQMRATSGDDWRRELFEAGDFDPAVAARVLQSLPAALQAMHTTPNAWVIADIEDAKAETKGLRQVARSGRWALYASPDRPLTPEGPEAAQDKGLPGCQHRRREPRQ